MFVFSWPAFAELAIMTFDVDVGPLTFHAGGGGTVTANSGQAVVSGAQITLISNDGGSTAAVSTDTVTVAMVLRPAVDAGSGLGVIIIDEDNPTQFITALASPDGLVTLIDWIGNFRNVQFDFPNAPNNSLILKYDPFTERATLNINNSASPADNVFLDAALNGGQRMTVGVASNGTGGFDTLLASGNGINAFPSADSDGDGVSDVDENAAGTDPNDPGNLPVSNASGANITSSNGTTVDIPAGSLPSSSLNVSASATGSAPAGGTPGGEFVSGAGVDLGPNGTLFSAVVSVSIPYTAGDIVGIDEGSLTVFFFDGANYTTAGITNVSIDTGANTASFDIDHFSTFVVAGTGLDSDGDGTPDLLDAFPNNPFGATDVDGDGLGDEWEDFWFGDNNGTATSGELAIADNTTDFDSDGVSDLLEFIFAAAGFDPTDGATSLPTTTWPGLALLSALVAICAMRRRRRSVT